MKGQITLRSLSSGGLPPKYVKILALLHNNV